MFNESNIAESVKADFEAAVLIPTGTPPIRYGTAGFRAHNSVIAPLAYRSVFVLFCRALSARYPQPDAPAAVNKFTPALLNPQTLGDCGLIVTASHNIASDNGIKMLDPNSLMLDITWEAATVVIANAAAPSDFAREVVRLARERLPAAVLQSDALLTGLRARPVRIHVGRDTRPSGPSILAAIRAAAAGVNHAFSGAGGPPVLVLVDHGVLTTPTLHAMVYWSRHAHELPIAELRLWGRDPLPPPPTTPFTTNIDFHVGSPELEALCHQSAAAALSAPIQKELNMRLIFRAFFALWTSLVPVRSGLPPRHIVVDCSNGVGTIGLKEALALDLAVDADDRAAAGSRWPQQDDRRKAAAIAGEWASIRDILLAVAGIEIELVNDKTDDPTILNKECGTDFAQKTRRAPDALFRALEAYCTSHEEALMKALMSDFRGAQDDSNANFDVLTNFCAILSRQLNFYSLDGDADRVVCFTAVPIRPDASVELARDLSVAAILPHITLGFFDGDRIVVLVGTLLRNIQQTGVKPPPTGARPIPIGVVQTAYANGGSTKYIRDAMGIPVTCAATGVKFLHHCAEAMPIGIYFEANGHGTALLRHDLFGSHVTLRGADGAKEYSAIVPALIFGRNAGAEAVTPAVPGLRSLFLMRLLLSQCCGDAISGMLAAEVCLAAIGWTAFEAYGFYTDVPSVLGKVTVSDPSIIENTADEQRVVRPAALQEAVDAAVASVGGYNKVLARAFVRPSGTEPIVRVYAESSTEKITAELYAKVEAAVKDICK